MYHFFVNEKPRIYSPFFRTREKHYFHLVLQSQLPVVTAAAVVLLALNVVFYLHMTDMIGLKSFDHMNFEIAGLLFSTILFAGFLIVLYESGEGYHTLAVRKGLRFGMILFIVSEVMFFFAFFGAFFHVSLSPSIAIGGIGPPKSIQALDVGGLPLVNTLLLLSSGVTITLAHHTLMQNSNFNSTSLFDKYLLATILLGVTFLYCQGIEYKYGITFRGKENIYGSTFFVTTGFHGLHVTIGTIFLLFCLLRNLVTNFRYGKKPMVLDGLRSGYHPPKKLAREFQTSGPRLRKEQEKNFRLYVGDVAQAITSKYRMSKEQHLGFEAAAGYGHFVDVVGIFLFITIYGGGA